MSSSLGIVLAASLLREGMPHQQRVNRLKDFFNPPPDHEVRLDPKDIRDYGRKANPRGNIFALRGRIKVRPPRGHCFTLRGPPEDSDQTICKEKDIVFTILDIDRSGGLKWKVMTGPEDFGTELTWKTPYRLVILEPADSSPEDPPSYRFFASCEADEQTALGRRIRVNLLSGEEWSVRLPYKHELLPQPEPIPNLFIDGLLQRRGLPPSDTKQSSAEASETKEKAHGTSEENHAPQSQADSHSDKGGHGGDAAHDKGGSGEKKSTEASADNPQDDPLEDRKQWSIPTRDAYRLDASMFSTGIATARAGSGTCRYTFHGPDEDPLVGRLECHDIPGFRLIYLPLPCLAHFKPKQPDLTRP